MKFLLSFLVFSFLAITVMAQSSAPDLSAFVDNWDTRQEQLQNDCNSLEAINKQINKLKSSLASKDLESLLQTAETFKCDTNKDTDVDIVVHHTADTAEVQLDKTNRAHQRLGYSESCYGYYLGYHFFLGRDGTLIQTRCLDERPLHSKGSIEHGISERSVSIVLAGNFNEQEPTEEQLSVLKELIKQLHKRFDGEVKGHSHTSATECPGENLLKWLEREYRLAPASHGEEEHEHEDIGSAHKYDGVEITQSNEQMMVDSQVDLIRITSYNPEVAQNDASPCKGALGIDICHYSKQGVQVIALSQDLVNKSNTGKFTFGDPVTIKHPTIEACNFSGHVLDVMAWDDDELCAAKKAVGKQCRRWTRSVDKFNMSRDDNFGKCTGGTIEQGEGIDFWRLYPEQAKHFPQYI